MFERYTEKARRVIFFARYEASQFGQPYIETEHVLLGLLREDKALTNRFLRLHSVVESIRNEIAKNTTIREKVSTSVDLPLSNECKRVLAYAAEEAERLGHKHIGTEHLLLGLLREQGCFARQILIERGIELDKVREDLAKAPLEQQRPLLRATPSNAATQALTGFSTDLTQKAADGELQPVLARDLEVESVIEVLCKKERRNPMLLGPRGAGKSAIVQALAQRIAEGQVPNKLAEVKVVSVSTEALGGWVRDQRRFEDLAELLRTVANSANLILFMNGLGAPAGAEAKTNGQELLGMFRFAMEDAEARCIGAATPEEYAQACEQNPLLQRVFSPLHVRPLDRLASIRVLQARKEGLEKFHEVEFADEALVCAIERADSYWMDRLLPGKALELLDAAGAAAKAQVSSSPEDISEVMKRLAFITHRQAQAIENHEFEKARFYSDEEKKERESLAALRVKYGMENAAPPTVRREDVERIIAKWGGYPYVA